jgi:hypothetical protein
MKGTRMQTPMNSKNLATTRKPRHSTPIGSVVAEEITSFLLMPRI